MNAAELSWGGHATQMKVQVSGGAKAKREADTATAVASVVCADRGTRS